VWAVGRFASSTGGGRLVVRWTGSKWVRVPLPSRLAGGLLDTVHVFSNTNVWAGGDDAQDSFLIHYDGHAWTSITPSPLADLTDAQITGIAAADPAHLSVSAFTSDPGTNPPAGFMYSEAGAAGWLEEGAIRGPMTGISVDDQWNVWAVGSQVDHTTKLRSPYLMRLHGDVVTAFFDASPPPYTYTTDHVLTAVTAISANNVWAVGYRVSAVTGRLCTLIYTYYGAGVIDLGGPNVPGVDNQLGAIAAVPGVYDLWAVGSAGSQPLILHAPVS